MNKFKQIILPAVFIILSAIIIFAGYTFLGYIKLPVSLLPAIQNNDNGVLLSNEEIISQIVSSRMSIIKKSPLSDDMRGIWINIEADYEFESLITDDVIRSAIYSDFDYYRNFTADTVFLKFPEKDISAGSEDFDPVKYILYCADLIGCDVVLVADEDILFDSKMRFSSKRIDNLLSTYEFDAILYSCESFAGSEDYYSNYSLLKDFLDENYSSLYFGIEVFTDVNSLFADEYTIKLFSEKPSDFAYVDCAFTTDDSQYPFGIVALWWNSFADYYDIPIYCEHRTDKIFTDELWNDSNEISYQMKVLYNCPQFKGSCFYKTSTIKSKKALARDLSIFLNDVAGVLQDSMCVDSLQIDSVSDVVTFTGKAVENNQVFCNGEAIKITEGSFFTRQNLSKFENIFNFRSAGAEYTYSIRNNITLFSSYYPSSDTQLDGDKNITIYSVSPSGAAVFAVINGNFYEMTENGLAIEESVPAGFSTYSCTLSFSDTKIRNGRLTMLCIYDGVYSTVECGNLYLYSLFSSSETDNIHNSACDVSPYTDNGLGKSLMCITLNDNTEQISKVDDYDTYYPYRSSLLKGTLDYVDKISVSDEGYLVYELRSGINLYGVDCTLINNAYNLPLNSIDLVSCYESDGGRTELIFDTDWISPITVTPEKQNYKKGYLEFSFNIDSFDATYIDLSFYYSDSINLNNMLVLPENSVFSSYELISSENNVQILRLYLKYQGSFYGFDITETVDGNIMVSFAGKKNNSLEGKTVMLDPGHGGLSMVGTALKDNSVSESSVTLAIANIVRRQLEMNGANVIMTRDRDTSLSLYSRTVMCETANPDIYVSIHCDGSESSSESGTHTFYFTPYSHSLAESVHKSLVDTYSDRIYSEADDNYSRIDRKIKYYPFYVTRVDNCPSVLVETGFMTNHVEGYVLVNPVNQELLGQAIAEGIKNYFCNSY